MSQGRQQGRAARALDRAEPVATILVAAVVGVLGMLDIADPRILSSATLAVLALVAYDLVKQGRRTLVIQSSLRRLPVAIHGNGLSSGEGIPGLNPPEPLLGPEGTDEIWLVGVTLNRTLRNHLRYLEDHLSGGGKLKVAILDPAGPGPGEAARRISIPVDRQFFEHRLEPTLDLLHHLAAGSDQGQLEVRLLPFVPAFGLVAEISENADARISVEVYSHRPSGAETHFRLHRSSNPVLYRHFSNEFRQIWSSGSPLPVRSGRPEKGRARTLPGLARPSLDSTACTAANVG